MTRPKNRLFFATLLGELTPVESTGSAVTMFFQISRRVVVFALLASTPFLATGTGTNLSGLRPDGTLRATKLPVDLSANQSRP